MKDPRELLGLLTVKVQRFSVAPGGIPAITPEDVAHILGMISNRRTVLFARVKYADQKEFAEELADLMRTQVLQEIEGIAKWRNGPDWVLSMCRLALAESVHPHTCSWCLGRAELILDEGKRIICDGCKGTGRRTWRDADRAKKMEITKQAWSNHWSDRYRLLCNVTVDRYEDMIVGAIQGRKG